MNVPKENVTSCYIHVTKQKYRFLKSNSVNGRLIFRKRYFTDYMVFTNSSFLQTKKILQYTI